MSHGNKPKHAPKGPFAQKTAALYKGMRNAVTPEDIEAVVDTVIAAALAGNLDAIRLVLRYGLGAPPAGVSPSDARASYLNLFSRQ
jgi:hypothetical protein